MIKIGIIGHGGIGKTTAAKYLTQRFKQKEYMTTYYSLLTPFKQAICLCKGCPNQNLHGEKFLDNIKPLDTKGKDALLGLMVEIIKKQKVDNILLNPLWEYMFKADPSVIIVDDIVSLSLYKELRNNKFRFIRVDPGIVVPTKKTDKLSRMLATYVVNRSLPGHKYYDKLDNILHSIIMDFEEDDAFILLPPELQKIKQDE